MQPAGHTQFYTTLTDATPSIPGVRLPRLPATVLQAMYKLRESVTQFHKSQYGSSGFSRLHW